jgi:hypothetical protein
MPTPNTPRLDGAAALFRRVLFSGTFDLPSKCRRRRRSGDTHGAVASRKGAQQVPRLPPDFLSSLVVSIDLVRLSLLKAAYVAVDECCVVGNPECARDDKGEGGDFY